MECIILINDRVKAVCSVRLSVRLFPLCLLNWWLLNSELFVYVRVIDHSSFGAESQNKRSMSSTCVRGNAITRSV